MLELIEENRFIKDVKKAKKRGNDMALLFDIVEMLLKNIPLPKENRNHKLKGKYIDHWECHIESDWLLVYRKTDTEIILVRLGTHSDLFK